MGSSVVSQSKSQAYKTNLPNIKEFSFKKTESNFDAEDEEEGIKSNESPESSSPRIFFSEIPAPIPSTYRNEDIQEDDEFIVHSPESPLTNTRNKSSEADLISLVPVIKIKESSRK